MDKVIDRNFIQLEGLINNSFHCVFLNVYAPSSAKLRSSLWQGLSQEKFIGEWMLDGDFSMVKARQDRTRLSSILSRAKLVWWMVLKKKWFLVDSWKIGPHRDKAGLTYQSLQFTQTTSWLDRVHFPHNTNRVPCSLRMRILIGESLLDHFPVACNLFFYNVKDVKPMGKAKLLVTNATLFKDQPFRDLVSKVARNWKVGFPKLIVTTLGGNFVRRYKGLSS